MINVANVTKHYGNKVLYRGASFQLNPGEKVGLVGPNGAGKTTIFRILCGEEGVDEGQVAKPERVVITSDQLVAAVHGKLQIAADKAVHTAISDHLMGAVRQALKTAVNKAVKLFGALCN